MPYIPAETRRQALIAPQNVGELCYTITQLCSDYLAGKSESFARYGEIRHALDTTWDVHFLPKLLEYEKRKRDQNGDVR